MNDRLLIGTRGSALALAQTRLIVEALRVVHPGLEVRVVPVKTAGDVLPPEARGGVDGKSAFTGEIDRRLKEGELDCAVHSMKDIPGAMDPSLVIAATPTREDARDVLVASSGRRFSTLGAGARIGTSSIRRKAQLLSLRDDLNVVEVHGNVETRIRKMELEALDGVVLAAAGLRRLGLESKATETFSVEDMVPAPCQGVLAVIARSGDSGTLGLLKELDDPATRAESLCERSFSQELGGDCYVPLGAFAKLDGATITAVGLVADPEGRKVVKSTHTGGSGSAADVGKGLALKVIEGGGREILRDLAA